MKPSKHSSTSSANASSGTQPSKKWVDIWNPQQTISMMNQQNRTTLVLPKTGKTPILKVAMCGAILIWTPLAFYDFWAPPELPYEVRMSWVQLVLIGWESMMHISPWPVLWVSAAAAFFLANKCVDECCPASEEDDPKAYGKAGHRKRTQCLAARWTVPHYVVAISLVFSLLSVIHSQLQIIVPSMLWNPFLWFRYRVVLPDNLKTAVQGLCVDYDPARNDSPLCLSEKQWAELSVDTISSRNPEDVATVLKGLEYAQRDDSGLILNVMSRDTIDAIPALRQNTEALKPFFKKLSVVVYENDSSDGTRDAFKAWAKEAQEKKLGYDVDLISCGEDNPDCVFHISHRYDATEAKDYFKSSAIGKMADFRQTMVDYILGAEKYADYSHMLVFDIDLGVTLSPLGLIHTLGKKPDKAVASSGRQSWPGSLGSIVPPYDFSGFRALETARNRRMLAMHQRLCEQAPPGDRWRNQCDAVSAIQLMLVLGHDRGSGTEPYPVASAFNGATLYPLQLIRETDAKYDVGDDGQRCEHIGFNLGLKTPMFVNPKWNFHIRQQVPGGPTGPRAFKNVMRIAFNPKLGLPIFFVNVGSVIPFVYCVMILVLHVLHPIWVKAMTGTRRFRSVGWTTVPPPQSTEGKVTSDPVRGGNGWSSYYPTKVGYYSRNWILGPLSSAVGTPRQRKVSDMDRTIAESV